MLAAAQHVGAAGERHDVAVDAARDADVAVGDDDVLADRPAAAHVDVAVGDDDRARALAGLHVDAARDDDGVAGVARGGAGGRQAARARRSASRRRSARDFSFRHVTRAGGRRSS